MKRKNLVYTLAISAVAAGAALGIGSVDARAEDQVIRPEIPIQVEAEEPESRQTETRTGSSEAETEAEKTVQEDSASVQTESADDPAAKSAAKEEARAVSETVAAVSESAETKPVETAAADAQAAIEKENDAQKEFEAAAEEQSQAQSQLTAAVEEQKNREAEARAARAEKEAAKKALAEKQAEASRAKAQRIIDEALAQKEMDKAGRDCQSNGKAFLEKNAKLNRTSIDQVIAAIKKQLPNDADRRSFEVSVNTAMSFEKLKLIPGVVDATNAKRSSDTVRGKAPLVSVSFRKVIYSIFCNAYNSTYHKDVHGFFKIYHKIGDPLDCNAKSENWADWDDPDGATDAFYDEVRIFKSSLSIDPSMRRMSAVELSRKAPQIFEWTGHYLNMVDPDVTSMGVGCDGHLTENFGGRDGTEVSASKFRSMLQDFINRLKQPMTCAKTNLQKIQKANEAAENQADAALLSARTELENAEKKQKTAEEGCRIAELAVQNAAAELETKRCAMQTAQINLAVYQNAA